MREPLNARIRLETIAARAVGRLSRAAGRGGGTTIPGKLLWKLDPSAVDALAARLPHGVALVSGDEREDDDDRDGRPDPRRAAAARVESRRGEPALGDRVRARQRRRRRARALRGRRGRAPGGDRPHAAARPCRSANLFRDQLDRYGELEIVAERWRDAVRDLPDETTLVVNADDPVVGRPRGGPPRVLRYGLDDPRHARPALQHAADSKYCVRCGTPYEYEAAYVGHLGAYRCPACGHARPELDVVAKDIELTGPPLVPLHDRRARAARSRVDLALPGLYNVYNATAATTLCLALGTSARVDPRGPRRVQRRVRPLRADRAGQKTIVILLIKNPAGANEALRTLETGVPPVLVVALNDAIADGQDVSWIWDVDFEPLLPHTQRVVATGERAAELGLRLLYGGLPKDRLEVVPALEEALDRGLEQTERWRRARRPPHLHGDARAARAPHRARPRARVLGRAAMRLRVGHLYPEYLNIYADRGNIAVLRAARSSAGTRSRSRRSASGTKSHAGAYDLYYVGGGQDREQAAIAPDLAAKGPAIWRRRWPHGAALLAVCGGYQLLGRGYRGRDGSFMPGVGLFPHETVAGTTRMIGDVLLECELVPGQRRTVAGFENHAGRTLLDEGAEPLGRVLHGFGNDGESGFEGCRVRAGDRDVPARPAASPEPVARGLAARAGGRPRHERGASGLRRAAGRACRRGAPQSPRSGRRLAADAARSRSRARNACATT